MEKDIFIRAKSSLGKSTQAMGKKDKEGNILYYLAHYRGYY
jgi:hypothetical protein